MLAHGTKRTVLQQKLIDTFRMKDVSTGELSDNGYSVVEIDETDMTAWLEVGSSIVAIDADTGSLAPNAGTGADAALIESPAAS